MRLPDLDQTRPVRTTRPFTRTCLVALAALIAAATVGPSRASRAQQLYEVVHGFSAERASSQAPLLLASDGFFYGTTKNGGPTGRGTIFRLEPNGAGGYDVVTLHEFSGADGQNPQGGLIEANDLALYGTTPVRSGGPGTVFRFIPGTGVTTIHSFTAVDGGNPIGRLVQGQDGHLYGTASSDGNFSPGVIFRVALSGAFTVLHHFIDGVGGTGTFPKAGLMQANDGNFYGVAQSGGANGRGTLFRMSPSGTVTVLHSFIAASGANPVVSLIQGADGRLYGTTDSEGAFGGGTVFAAELAGGITVLHSFNTATGASPRGHLLQTQDGLIYGVTLRGGTSNRGTIYRIDTTGTFTSLVSFGLPLFAAPESGLVEGPNGLLYGTTNGSQSALGNVYRFDRTNATLSLVDQFARSPGMNPRELMRAEDGNLYGSLYAGGAQDGGAIYKLAADSNVTLLRTTQSGVGTLAQGIDGNLYGIDFRTAFRLTPTGTYSTLHFFTESEGFPFPGGLTRGLDGRFYGLAQSGGAFGRGTIIAMTPTGAVTVLHSFNGTNGAVPLAPLLLASDGFLYGVTAQGGTGDAGTVFRVDPATGQHQLLHSFDGANGSAPFGGLLEGTDGLLYGTTPTGGTSNQGTVFSIAPGGGFTLLHSFNNVGGSGPLGRLAQSAAGYIYGTTVFGGVVGHGTVFRLSPAGTVVLIHSFDGSTGSRPLGGIIDVDGVLYGTTETGGPLGGGVVFRLTPNAPPVANHDQYAANEDAPLVVDGPGVLGNDTDAEGSPLTATLQSPPAAAHGVVTLNADGSFTFTPAAGFTGETSFSYIASDGLDESMPATVGIAVASVNDPPSAENSSLETNEDTAVVGSLSGTDLDSSTLIFSLVSDGTRGSVQIVDASTGQFTYTPHANANGDDTFRFKVSDGSLDSNVATVTVSIAAVNDPPVATGGVVATSEQTAVSGQFQAVDPDGDALTFSAAPSSHGTLEVTDPTSGRFTYTPHPGQIGYAPFAFEVSDGTASTAGTELVFIVASSPRWPGQTIRASVSPGGTSSGGAEQVAMSADGRFIAFESNSALVTTDTNNQRDIYLHDRQTSQIERISVSTSGAGANQESSEPAISADGQFVAFNSPASNLAAGANGQRQVYVRDRHANTTTLVSRSSAAVTGNFRSHHPTISADGRSVAFYSTATNLVDGDTNGWQDIFVHDRQTNTTTRVLGIGGAQPNNDAWDPEISADGQRIAFWSSATNLSPEDSDAFRDVFVHDRTTGTTLVASMKTGAIKTTGTSMQPHISGDGRIVAFMSIAQLVPNDTNNVTDIYVHDVATRETTLASVGPGGTQTNGQSHTAALSADGRYVAFSSEATNLASDDNNATWDVFVHDRQTTQTRRVSVNSAGAQVTGANAPRRDYTTRQVAVSGDGQFVAFRSDAADLDSADGNAIADIFVVGGVKVDPTAVSVERASTNVSIDVSFAYPGTFWSATSQASWLTTTSSGSAGGTATIAVAQNSGAARNGTVLVATQAVTIQQGGNATPVAVADTATTSEDTAVLTDVTANDTDADGDSVFVIVSTVAGQGTAEIVDAATIRYTPAANFHGTDSFQYKVRDAFGADSAMTTVTVTVTTVNDAPQAGGPDTAVTAEDTAVTLRPADNDSDVDGDQIVITAFTATAHGTLTQPDMHTLIYTPAANYHGPDGFSYSVSDGSGATATAPVTITVTPVNDPPVAVADVAMTPEDVAIEIAVLANDGDVDGEAVFLATLSQPDLGTAAVTADGQRIRYTPAADYHGPDTFRYAIRDSVGATTPVVTVQLTVTSVNDAPTTHDGTLAATEDQPATGNLAAADVDGDALTFSIVSNGAKGAVVITDTATGTFTYTPNANANGADSFTFRVTDGDLHSNSSIVEIAIAAINDAPVAQDGSNGGPKQTPITGQLLATDVEGSSLVYSLVQQVTQGSVTVNADGSYSYISASNATGVDQFSFRASDGLLDSNVATVSVTILSSSGAPLANDSAVTTAEDTTATGVLSAAAAAGATLTFSIDTNGIRGTATITNAGTGAFTYTPNANVSGDDSFTFRVSDGTLTSNRGTVSVTIQPVNDAPVASDGSLLVAEDREDAGILIGSDVDGDALTFALVNVPAKGTVSITNPSTGRYTFVPRQDAFGNDVFSFLVNDGTGASNVATVTVLISGVNDTPNAEDSAFSTTVNTALSATLPASDPDGDALTFTISRAPRDGTLTVDASTGAFTYVPNANFSGQDSFRFRVSDGVRNSLVATVTVTVVP